MLGGCVNGNPNLRRIIHEFSRFKGRWPPPSKFTGGHGKNRSDLTRGRSTVDLDG
jgi:hypothetical protein